MPQGFRFDLLAKSGYTARGIVFLLVAGLALFSGVSGGRPETKSALSTLLQQPFGRVWVGLIGLGLLGFVVWRLAQSLADSDGRGSGAKALVIRIAWFGSAVTYLSLAAFAIGHALIFGGGSDEAGEKDLAEWIMSKPFGSYLAITVGAGFIIGGGITAAKGLTKKFERYLRIPNKSGAITAICIYGLVARGLVFAITGVLFAYAGFRVDPAQAGSIADALQWLRQLPFGSVLYIAVAVGLAAFGFYNLVEARYRIVREPSLNDVKRALPTRGL
ncbi:DUF1206 domain-containing protein [Rhizobium mesosinicum]|uniref:DUF1206 domain-containing protein n=1 Tax=Rhizobium mesosinicum TaxID=335017 RepID=A0ABS7GNG4_9HYPH|nr:DUF1206 domain-containing protein [Rhizobium mesosinicum]MBW9050950.1 DUF1206 domain-containing protein [Rhizobium mesosinicum]